MAESNYPVTERLHEWAKAAAQTAGVMRELPGSMFSSYDKAKLEGFAAGLHRAATEVYKLEQERANPPQPAAVTSDEQKKPI